MFGRKEKSEEGGTAVMERAERSADEALEAMRKAAEEIEEAADEVSSSRGGRRLIGLVAIGVLAALIVVWRSR